jgi:hypothetical protein
MNTVRDQASFFSEAHTILTRAKRERKDALLREGAALLDSHDFNAIPEWQQRRLSELYAEAHYAVTGGFA